MIRIFGKSLGIAVVILFLAGCASTSKKEKPTPAGGGATSMDESFDPVILNDDDITFKSVRKETSIEEPQYLPREESPQIDTVSSTNHLVDGYRIQLLSTKDLESASRAKAIAMEQFSDIQVKFYLEFDSPYYKVRLGDFKTREEAESVREVVRSRGYPKAWIIKTRVWSSPEFPVQKDSLSVDTPDSF